MKLRFLLVVAVLALIAGACGAGSESGSLSPGAARALSYSLTGDEVLTYHTEIDMNVTTNFGQKLRSLDPSFPSSMDMDMEMSMDTTYQIGAGPEPGSYRVAMTTSNLDLSKAEAQMGDEKMDLSDLPQSELDAAMNSAMPEFVYVIDDKGEVVSVEVDGVAVDVNALLSGTSGGGLSGGQLFGPELPDGEVNIGDTWTTTSEQEFGAIAVVTEETHKILRSEEYRGHNTWVIKTESKTGAYTITWNDMVALFEEMGGIQNVDGMEDMPPSFQMAIRLSPSSSTTITWLDPEFGTAVAADISSFVAMTVEIGGLPGLSGSFSMDADTALHMVMELVVDG